jgi:predicted RNase H-like HicB family nuclease
MLYRFLVVFEKAEHNYSAYSPDLPGCVAVGDSLEEVERNMEGAIRMHIQGMLEDNEPIPVPRNRVQYIEIQMPDSAA